MISVICIKSGKKKLPPADIISQVSVAHVASIIFNHSTSLHELSQHHITEKGYKDSDRFSTTSEMKDPDRDYSEYSGTDNSTATRMNINILSNGGYNGVPLAGPIKNNNEQRYSGDYTDMHVAHKIGLTNTGYIPHSDYSREYSPSNSIRANNMSLKNHLISSSGHSPLMSTPINEPIDHYSLRGRELRQDNGLPALPLSTIPNGMTSKYYAIEKRCCADQRRRDRHLTQTSFLLDQSLLNNVDIRFSATYGNPFLKSSNITPLPPPNGAYAQKPFTANPSVTPAPPPYYRNNNSNSSFSSSTTISNNYNAPGLCYPSNPSTAVTATATTNSLSQITSPSRQFILPANGDLKQGSLATHV